MVLFGEAPSENAHERTRADAACSLLNSQCDVTGGGAVTGTQVIFSFGELVLAQPY
jgi:hypothetical protein